MSDQNTTKLFWNSVKLDDSSGPFVRPVVVTRFWNSVKLDDSSGGLTYMTNWKWFWNSVKLDDSSGSNYTASKNKK